MPASFASIAYLLAAGAGLSFVFQQAVNATLRAEIDSPWWAGFYLGGTLAMLIGTGQMIGSLAFDHFGRFGVPVHSLRVSRRIGDERPDLDENRAWPYSPRMINASTILIARRRRAIAVWAVVCV